MANPARIGPRPGWADVRTQISGPPRTATLALPLPGPRVDSDDGPDPSWGAGTGSALAASGAAAPRPGPIKQLQAGSAWIQPIRGSPVARPRASGPPATRVLTRIQSETGLGHHDFRRRRRTRRVGVPAPVAVPLPRPVRQRPAVLGSLRHHWAAAGPRVRGGPMSRIRPGRSESGRGTSALAGGGRRVAAATAGIIPAGRDRGSGPAQRRRSDSLRVPDGPTAGTK